MYRTPSKLDHTGRISFDSPNPQHLHAAYPTQLVGGNWGLLIGRLILPPVGVIDGLGVWLGLW
jgi:hypothetical protein